MYVRYSRGAQNTALRQRQRRLAALPRLARASWTPSARRATSPSTTARRSRRRSSTSSSSASTASPSASTTPTRTPATNSPVILNIPTDPLNSSPARQQRAPLTTYQIVDNLSWQTRRAHAEVRHQPALPEPLRRPQLGRRLQHARDRHARRRPTTPCRPRYGTRAPTAHATPASTAPTAARLESYINDFLGRIGRIDAGVRRRETTRPSRPRARASSTRREYPEYDFYGQDTWKVAPEPDARLRPALGGASQPARATI